MRVLLTTDTIGGVWTFTKELSQQLLQLGHDVALVSFGREPSPDQREWSSHTLDTYSSAFMYTESSVPLEWMQENQAVYDDGAAILLETARHFKPDLLHSSQYCFGRLPLPIPKLLTAHSDVLSWAAACHPQGLEPSAWLDRYISFVQQGLESADAVVAPTRWMLDALSMHFNVPHTLAVIPNGRTLAQTPQPDQRLLQAVSVGRLWDEAKGLSTLTFLDSPLPLFIAGEECLETRSSLHLSTNINSLGFLSEEDILALFRVSSIYLATSLYEPFGLAPLEAALCGCAIVARDLPSFREVWGDAANYFSDATSLEHLLHDLSTDAVSLRSAQAVALYRASTFTASRMASDYLSLYQHLLTCDATTALGACKEGFASHAA